MEKGRFNFDCDWSEIDGEVLGYIIQKLNLCDYVRCGAVCSSWHTVSSAGIGHKKTQSLVPVLLIPPAWIVEEDEDGSGDEDENEQVGPYNGNDISFIKEEDIQMRSLYSLYTNRVCDMRIKVAYNRHCRGSGFGWLISLETTDVHKYHVQLFNPFLPENKIISLPPLDKLAELDDYNEIRDNDPPTIYLRKAVLSASPASASDKYVVMAIVGDSRALACYIPGTTKDWLPIEWDKRSSLTMVCDVIYFNKTQQFYAVLMKTGSVSAIDLGNPVPRMTPIAPPPSGIKYGWRYLVETSDDLLQVHITGDNEQIQVFKLDSRTKGWSELQSLGGDALFLGKNTSISVRASSVPGCKPNCIYITDEGYPYDIPHHYSDDNLLFDMERKTFQLHYPLGPVKFSSPPIWLSAPAIITGI